MLSFSRRAVGVLARLLVVLLALGTSVPFAAHDDADHDPCEQGAPSTARASLHAPGASPKPQHCEVCHWLRTLRSFDTVVSAPTSAVEPGGVTPSLVASPGTPLRLSPAPSRAPPRLSVL